MLQVHVWIYKQDVICIEYLKLIRHDSNGIFKSSHQFNTVIIHSYQLFLTVISFEKGANHINLR